MKNKELELSYDILKTIYVNKKYSQIELNQQLKRNNIVSHGLVTKIVYGVLENDILLEFNINRFVKKPPQTKVLILLKMGAYIAHFLNSIPTYALVSELVEIAKKTDKAVAGFVNATLKSITNNKLLLPSRNNIVEYLSIKHSYPQWLIARLLKAYGEKELEAILNHKLNQLTHIRIINLKKKQEFVQKLTDAGVVFEQSVKQNALYVNYEQLLKQTELSGYYTPMGVASMNLVDCMENVGGQVLDACAAPGGKAIYLAQKNKNANVVACDIHEHRVGLVNGQVQKYDLKNIETRIQDATLLNNEFVNKFDAVLLDAPCSGIGVAGSKPDILLNRKDSDIVVLSKLQLAMLNTSAKYVKSGGQLFYSTCTITKEENQDVVAAFLAQNKDFKLIPINSEIKAINEDNMLTFLPHISNCEGFFIARMVKN